MMRPSEKEVVRHRDTVTATFDCRRLSLEQEAYQRLLRLLGENCRLPHVVGFRDLDEGRAAFELERIRGRDLAHIFYASRDQATIERMCRPHVESVLDILDEWARVDSGEDPAILIREIREAIASRIERLRNLPAEVVPPHVGSEILPPLDDRLARLASEEKAAKLARQLPYLTPSHKDLKTGNIFVEPNGTIRFIDPRLALHWAKSVSSGHVLIDWVQFGFNIRRIWDADNGEQTARINLAKAVDERIYQWLMRNESCGCLEQVLRDIQTHRYLNSLYHLLRVGRYEDGVRLADFLAAHVRDTYVAWKPRRTSCSYPGTSTLRYKDMVTKPVLSCT